MYGDFMRAQDFKQAKEVQNKIDDLNWLLQALQANEKVHYHEYRHCLDGFIETVRDQITRYNRLFEEI